MIKDAHLYNFKACKLYVFTCFLLRRKTDRETYNQGNLTNVACKSF